MILTPLPALPTPADDPGVFSAKAAVFVSSLARFQRELAALRYVPDVLNYALSATQTVTVPAGTG